MAPDDLGLRRGRYTNCPLSCRCRGHQVPPGRGGCDSGPLADTESRCRLRLGSSFLFWAAFLKSVDPVDSDGLGRFSLGTLGR